MPTSDSYFGNLSDKDQPTLNTVADYIADARTLLQDKIPDYRYDDPSLLIALNITLVEASRLRGDLFAYDLEHKGQVQSFTTVDDTYVAIEVKFRHGILYGICGHALARDQEDVQDIRSTTFMRMFNMIMIAGPTGMVAGGSGPGAQGGGAQ